MMDDDDASILSLILLFPLPKRRISSKIVNENKIQIYLNDVPSPNVIAKQTWTVVCLVACNDVPLNDTIIDHCLIQKRHKTRDHSPLLQVENAAKKSHFIIFDSQFSQSIIPIYLNVEHLQYYTILTTVYY